jgi:ribose transport system ATP-binding protein
VTLVAEGILKRFGEQVALDSVDLTLAPGSIHGLLGENGSGKSTLIKILSGLYAPDGGRLEIDGHEVRLPLRADEPAGLGLRFVHQDLGLIPTLTVAENFGLLALAENRTGWRTSGRSLTQVAAAALKRFNVDVDPSAAAASLTALEQALVAIVRAVDSLPETGGVLVLDEPTVYLPRRDVTQLFDLLRALSAEGRAILLVTHDLEEILEITDEVTVLRNGRNVGSRPTAGVGVPELVELIVGRQLATAGAASAERAQSQTREREPVLRVRGLCGDVADEVDLDLFPGEIVGLAGLGGSGFEELPYLIFGAQPARAGEIWIDSQRTAMSAMNPTKAVKAGLTLLPADRRRFGGLLALTVTDNITQPRLHEFQRGGLLRRAAMRRDASSLMDRFDVRPRMPEHAFGTLSGGNQQKTLLAKWLATEPRVLLVHEPTQGVDIGAREQIYAVLRAAAQSGRSVLCASSDFAQLADLTDRTLVFHRGRLRASLEGADLTKTNITAACLEG